MAVTSHPALLFDQSERVIFIDVGVNSRNKNSHSETISGAQRRVYIYFVYSDV